MVRPLQGNHQALAARRQATSRALINRAWHQLSVGEAGGAAPPPPSLVTEEDTNIMLSEQPQPHQSSLSRSYNPATTLSFHLLSGSGGLGSCGVVEGSEVNGIELCKSYTSSLVPTEHISTAEAGSLQAWSHLVES